MEAFPMAIVGFAVAFSVAKVYAVKHDYAIDGNQVLLSEAAAFYYFTVSFWCRITDVACSLRSSSPLE